MYITSSFNCCYVDVQTVRAEIHNIQIHALEVYEQIYTPVFNCKSGYGALYIQLFEHNKSDSAFTVISFSLQIWLASHDQLKLNATSAADNYSDVQHNPNSGDSSKLFTIDPPSICHGALVAVGSIAGRIYIRFQ
jgi:hypothetical protein